MPNHSSMTAAEQEAIFRRWLDVHLGLMLKIVRGCAAPQDQDDLFQDVLLQLWSSIPAFRGEAKETTWIYRVEPDKRVKALLIDYFRSTTKTCGESRIGARFWRRNQ
jgi:DNA-directed RNA polymerase specialized sigma24 family protein